MVNDLLIDYEYVLFCYNALRSGKRLNIDVDRINEVKRLLSLKNKSEMNEDDRLAIHRLSYIDGFLR